MSVRVRLTRVGSKKNPIWRVVVADQRSPRDGRFIETIGHYNPQTEPSTILIDDDRLQHWLDRGAQPTGTVKQLMKARRKGAAAAADEPVADEAPVVRGARGRGARGRGARGRRHPGRRAGRAGRCGHPSAADAQE